MYLFLFSQVLLQPQFIQAESLLLTTLKSDPCIVTTVASPTSLASTTTPVQSTTLQVGTLYETQCECQTVLLLKILITHSCNFKSKNKKS